MEKISIRKLTTKIAFEKGYRIRNNKAFSPKGKELKFQRKNGISHNYRLINISVSPNDIPFFTKRRSISIAYHFLLAYEKFGDNFFEKNIHVRHLNGNFDVVNKLKPTGILELAACLAIIRPSKRYLLGETWSKIFEEVWTAPVDGAYYFKKAHALAYAHLVVVHMNLLVEQST